MPEDTSEKQETTGAPEPVEQPESKASADDSLDSMLARIPSLTSYFGEAIESAEKPAEQEEPASAESPSEEPVAESESPSEGEGKQQEEDKQWEGVPSWARKRVEKLTAQRTALKEKVEAFEAKAETAEAKLKELETKVFVPQAPTSDNPLSNINSQKELNQQFEDAKKVKFWALENLDGGEVANKDGTTEYWDGQKVKKYLAWSETLMTEHIPNRWKQLEQQKAYLESKKTAEAETRKYYPNVDKAGTAERAQLDQWLKLFPEVQKFPDYKLIIMDYYTGLKLRESRVKSQNGQKAARNTPTLSAPSPASSGTKTERKNVLSKDLLNRIATDRTALDVFSESLIGGE